MKIPKWVDWIVVLLLALISAAVVFWQTSRLTVLWDLSYILENSYRISLGDIPYRDFPFPYAPLTFLTQAAIIKLTGRHFFHHVIYCAVTNALATVLTWRILLLLLRDSSNARLLALLLTGPLVVLGLYAIYPHPFYDPDCTFTVLACLFLLLRWNSRPNRVMGVITGAALVVPLFVKQNTGLAFLAGTIASLSLMCAIDIVHRRLLHKYVWLLIGIIAGLTIALGLVHFTVGLGNYVRWTVQFAAERRAPAFNEMLAIYKDRLLLEWLIVALLGGVTLWFARGRRLLVTLAAVLLAAPFIWSVCYLLLDSDPSEQAERLIGVWPFVILIGCVVVVISFVQLVGKGKQDLMKDFTVPLIVIATAHGAFLSQQLWGSTYALWPLLMILVATIIRMLRSDGPNIAGLIFASLVSVALLISGGFYLRSHERLDYAELNEGELHHSQLPALKGMAMRGEWLPDFEELVAYAEDQIPKEEGILFLPGEDLFYYATGRRPQFPVLMFDHTVNPYSPQQILQLARERNIKWLVVKDELQMQEEPIEHKDELMDLLMQDFEPEESLNNYEIYKRKSSDSDDNDSEAKAKASKVADRTPPLKLIFTSR